MTAKSKAARTLAAVLLVWALFFAWRFHGKSRIQSLQTLRQVQISLTETDNETLLECIVIPAAIQGRSRPEQTRFLRKALLDELSSEGILTLEQHSRFGSLMKIFPDEAEVWASLAGVNPDDCVAFRLERNGHRAEVVLAEINAPESTDESTYRIVRINNVRQMAEPHP